MGGGVGVIGLVFLLLFLYEDRYRNDVNNRIIFFIIILFSDIVI